jgi:hypothetical protein
MTNETDEIVTSVRLSASEHAALKRLAASEHRSLSGQIRLLIERAVAEADRAAA